MLQRVTSSLPTEPYTRKCGKVSITFFQAALSAFLSIPSDSFRGSSVQFIFVEWLAIALGIATGGFWFRDHLASRPMAELIAGFLMLVLTVGGAFELLEISGKWFQKFANETHRQIELVGDRAQRDHRANVNRELQRELRRLGCYDGKVDGVWGSRSKIALAEFLEATGDERLFGNSVPVPDATRLFKAAPSGVCGLSHPINQASTLKRYKVAHNTYTTQCLEYFLFLPVWKKSEECIALRDSRDELDQRLRGMGVDIPS